MKTILNADRNFMTHVLERTTTLRQVTLHIDYVQDIKSYKRKKKKKKPDQCTYSEEK